MKKPKLADLDIPTTDAEARRFLAERPLVLLVVGLALLIGAAHVREVRAVPKVKSRRPGRRYKARAERIAVSGTVAP